MSKLKKAAQQTKRIPTLSINAHAIRRETARQATRNFMRQQAEGFVAGGINELAGGPARDTGSPGIGSGFGLAGDAFRRMQQEWRSDFVRRQNMAHIANMAATRGLTPSVVPNSTERNRRMAQAQGLINAKESGTAQWASFRQGNQGDGGGGGGNADGTSDEITEAAQEAMMRTNLSSQELL